MIREYLSLMRAIAIITGPPTALCLATLGIGNDPLRAAAFAAAVIVVMPLYIIWIAEYHDDWVDG